MWRMMHTFLDRTGHVAWRCRQLNLTIILSILPETVRGNYIVVLKTGRRILLSIILYLVCMISPSTMNIVQQQQYHHNRRNSLRYDLHHHRYHQQQTEQERLQRLLRQQILINDFNSSTLISRIISGITWCTKLFTLNLHSVVFKVSIRFFLLTLEFFQR